MGQRILVVDDDSSNRAVTRMALEDVGYVVEEAENGARALELLRLSAEPLVALVDLRMPRLDGTGLLQVVAEDETGLATRHAYIVVTANMDGTIPEVTALRERLGAPLLIKPFSLDELYTVVAHMAAQLIGA